MKQISFALAAVQLFLDLPALFKFFKRDTLRWFDIGVMADPFIIGPVPDIALEYDA
jgi:hypothetical protein